MDASSDAFRAPPAKANGIVRPGAAHASSRSTPPEDALPARVALCLHRVGPGTTDEPARCDGPHDARDTHDHVDLFIGPSDAAAGTDDDARTAHSWRLPVAARDWRTQLRTTGAVRWPATPTPAHRALYLRLAHPRTLDGGRGTVEPLAAGDGWMRSRPGHLVAEVRLAPADHDGAAMLLRVEVCEDPDGTTAELRVLEARDVTTQDG